MTERIQLSPSLLIEEANDDAKHYEKQELSVAALRARAREQRVDTSYRSSGGAAPLAMGEAPRPVTSNDVVKMFKFLSQNTS
mgnify:CR=1 FL=1